MTAKRSTRTEQKIRAALTELLPKKGLAGTTVSEICRAADINRGTFYAHYTDKFDLMDKQVEQLAQELSAIVLGEGAGAGTKAGSSVEAAPADDGCELFAKDRVTACLAYVLENYAFISAITEHGADTRLRDFVKDLIGELFEKSAAARGVALRFEGDDYGREMLLSGITSVFWLWLSKGCPESPEEICDIVWTHKTLSPEEIAGV